jgi:plasmid maintenance system antidote protein VapI
MSKSSTTTREIATHNRGIAHPGEVLNEEFLKPLEMSVNALAMALRVPPSRLFESTRDLRIIAISDISLAAII